MYQRERELLMKERDVNRCSSFIHELIIKFIYLYGERRAPSFESTSGAPSDCTVYRGDGVWGLWAKAAGRGWGGWGGWGGWAAWAAWDWGRSESERDGARAEKRKKD
jgi:hypothetical protein